MIIARTIEVEFQVTAEVKRDGKRVDLAEVPQSLYWETDGRFVEGGTTKYALRNNNFTATLCIEYIEDFGPTLEMPEDAWEGEYSPSYLLNQIIWEAIAEKHNEAMRNLKEHPDAGKKAVTPGRKG